MKSMERMVMMTLACGADRAGEMHALMCRVIKKAKEEAVLKPYILQDALAEVAREQNIPQLLKPPFSTHLKHCQEVRHCQGATVLADALCSC